MKRDAPEYAGKMFPNEKETPPVSISELLRWIFTTRNKSPFSDPPTMDAAGVETQRERRLQRDDRPRALAWVDL